MRYKITDIWKREWKNNNNLMMASYYLQVEQKLKFTGRIEKVWINPMSIPEDLDTSKVNVGDIVVISCKRFEDENVHAMSCRCSKCSGIFKEIIEQAKKQGTIIINSSGKSSKEVVAEVVRLSK